MCLVLVHSEVVYCSHILATGVCWGYELRAPPRASGPRKETAKPIPIIFLCSADAGALLVRCAQYTVVPE